jgi:hypothetical protein
VSTLLKEVFADSPSSPGVPVDIQATMFLGPGLRRRRLVPRHRRLRHPFRRRSEGLAAHRGDAGQHLGVRLLEQAHRGTRRGDRNRFRNTLILQNCCDNATPWEGGLGLYQALGDKSVLVGVDKGGHYVYNEGSTCADKATIDFLTTGHLPNRDVYCTDVKQE